MAAVLKVRHINLVLFGVVMLVSGITIGHTSLPQFVREVWAAAIDGFGTVNQVVAFTNTSTIGDSIITDTGTSIGIGTVDPSPWALLDVRGRIAAVDSLQLRGGPDLLEGGELILNHFGDQGAGERRDSWSIDNDVVGKFRIFFGSAAFGNNVLALSALPSGNVSIGGPDPGAIDRGVKLTVQDAAPQLMLRENNDQPGWKLWGGGNLHIREGSTDHLFIQGGTGNVRIGEGTPMTKLDVGGFIKIGTSGEPCDDAHTGMLGTNDSRNLFYCKDASTGWRQINP